MSQFDVCANWMKLREHLQSLDPSKFDMNNTLGMPCDIIGHAFFLEFGRPAEGHCVREAVMDWLGLEEEGYDWLNRGHFSNRLKIGDITLSEAIVAVEHIMFEHDIMEECRDSTSGYRWVRVT